MSFWKVLQVLIIPVLISLPSTVEAASAFGRVSVNIVASATTSLSGSILLTGETNQQKLSTDGMDKAGVNVSSSGDMVYDVSISSANTIKDTTGRRLNVEKLQLSSSSSLDHSHYVSGAVSHLNDSTESKQTDSDPYANMVNITVNYN